MKKNAENPQDSPVKGAFGRRGMLASMLATVPVLVASPLSVGGLGAQAAYAAPSASRADKDNKDTKDNQRATALDPGNVMSSLRFGMFVHFNPSSVVGREIGWGRNAYRPGEAPFNQYKDQSVTSDPEYDTAYRSFLPEQDWATKLAETAKAAGMNYLVFTTKHHDGYPNFRADNVTKSAYPDYADTPVGQSGRDLTREIADATRSAGLKLGFYYSPRDWTQPDYVGGDYATYYEYMMSHLNQLMTEYGDVDFLWYDSIPYADMTPFRPPLLHTVPRDLQAGILINDRGYSNMGFATTPPTLIGDFTTPEQQVGGFNAVRPWESCMTITPPSWSWQPNHPKSDMSTVVKTIAATAVGDGNLLLNVPPTQTGYLEDEVTNTLLEVGAWMEIYKKTIVGTRGGPYRNSGVGGATYAGNKIYLHITDDLRPFTLRLPRLNATVKSAVAFDGTSVAFSEESATGDLLLDVSSLTKTTPDLVVVLTVDREMTSEFVTRAPMAWEVVRPGPNLALNKPAVQHSTAWGGLAARAVDGNTNGSYDAGSVTHTLDTKEAWWQVDLGASTNVGQVWIYNRTDASYGDRLSNFWVMVSETEFASQDLTASRTTAGVTAVRIDGKAGDMRAVALNGAGRYVRLQLEAANMPLSLAEVEVYAR
ncbi:alpha-L-fucosidase [Luethyella okanaganae]|uniref:alpha-L-fucosidase n=1 Tax=Luethyella okanaganae TaxID=69372 RepID=A0ABW1VFQ4_9MICO